MATSLQDQLLQLGLVKQQQVKQARTAQRKQQRSGTADATAQAQQQAVQAAVAHKQAQDRELNRQREIAAQQRAEQHALRELIHTQRLARDGADVAYHFTDGRALKRLYVTAAQQRALVAGQIALVRQDTFYELIPAAVAERIITRDADCILVWNRADATPPAATNNDDDAYAAYQVPDHLMW